jgi:hypothetical protein
MHDTEQARTTYRVTIQEAARRLGVKEPAIRKRIERGTLEKERAEDGRVYVYIDEPPIEERDAGHDTGHDASHPAGYDALINSQEQQIKFLQKELHDRTEEIRRRDVIISQLTQRIPELESASEPTDSRQSARTVQETPVYQEQSNGTQEDRQRPWWRRVFGS